MDEECTQLLFDVFKDFKSGPQMFIDALHGTRTREAERDEEDPHYVENLIKYGKSKPRGQGSKQPKSSERQGKAGARRTFTSHTGSAERGHAFDLPRRRMPGTLRKDGSTFTALVNCSQSTSQRVNEILRQNQNLKLDPDKEDSSASGGDEEVNYKACSTKNNNFTTNKSQRPPIAPTRPTEGPLKRNKKEVPADEEERREGPTPGGPDHLAKKDRPVVAGSMRQQSEKAKLVQGEQLRHNTSQRALRGGVT